MTTHHSPQLRTLPDRIRQIALFEVGGLLLISPPFIWLSGVAVHDSITLLVIIAFIAALWNAAYNVSGNPTAFFPSCAR
ncbi:MAG: chlorhexidine efflux transporter [Azonexus sp.]|nr:chlorhexidine efflux transporter [Azonexus sp.]